jgi:DNA polymerase-3 subunit delta'
MVVPFNRTLRVGSIRALEAEANYRPYEAAARVFIIDDAHKMNAASANALLKTLEEPPPSSHIFLVTSKPDALLPTIRSRVQTLRFGPVETTEIEQFLLRTHEYSQDDARLIAATSGGSVSHALRFAPEAFRELRDQAVDILRTSIISGDLAEALKQSEKIGARSTPEFEEFLDILQSLIHILWSARLAGDYDGLPADLSGMADNCRPDRLASWLEVIEQIRSSLNVNINKKAASDALFVRMAAGLP